MLKKYRGTITILFLLLLGAVPIVAGIFRALKIIHLDGSPDNARFLENPVSAFIHILGATLFAILGPFQFASNLRLKWPQLHRWFGLVLIISVISVALSGLWMTYYYPAANLDGVAVYIARWLVGAFMFVFILLGINSIRQRNYIEHGNWMIRTYALGLGAGTQALTHLPWLFLPLTQGELSRAISMCLGWLINIFIAEWIITRIATITHISDDRQTDLATFRMKKD